MARGEDVYERAEGDSAEWAATGTLAFPYVPRQQEPSSIYRFLF